MLTQDQRIAISKKFVELPIAIVKSDETIDIIGAQKDEIEELDLTHKALIEEVNPLIEAYGGEYSYIDGNSRQNLTEQHMVDGANRIIGNYFFPNQPTVSVPSIPGNVWKFLNPFSNNIAEGKLYSENFPSVGGEVPTYASITSAINSIQSGWVAVERVTGNTCDMDVISADPALASALSSLISLVNTYKTALLTELTFLSDQLAVDDDVANNANTNTAINDINNNILPAINTWLGLVNFDPQTAADCASFYAINVGLLLSTKLQDGNVAALEAALATRQTFISTRSSQLNTILGSAGQNLSTGAIDNTGSGLYDRRFRLINLRLNAITGSLSRLVGIERSIDVQEQMKANNIIALATYGLVMSCSGFRSPSVGSKIVHVMNGALFTVSDVIYVVTDDHPELTGTITAINGNAITLSFSVPQKYTVVNFGRLYKVL